MHVAGEWLSQHISNYRSGLLVARRGVQVMYIAVTVKFLPLTFTNVQLKCDRAILISLSRILRSELVTLNVLGTTQARLLLVKVNSMGVKYFWRRL